MNAQKENLKKYFWSSHEFPQAHEKVCNENESRSKKKHRMPKTFLLGDSLLPGQDPHDRLDIVARVFRLKVQKLLEMLKSEMVFGKPQVWLYSIEWQKRGLPHCHLLLWLIAEHKITPDKIDDVICAEIPNPTVDLNYTTL